MIFNQEIAEIYDDWYETPLGNLVDGVEKDLVFKLARPQPEEKVLDLGCGTGNYSFELAKKGLQVSGIDVSEPMLSQARKKAERKDYEIDFTEGDIEALPYTDQTFDLITAVTVLEFVESPGQVLKEAWRVLKEGGRLVVGVLSAESVWAEVYRQSGESPYQQAHFYTPREVLKLLPAKEGKYEIGLHFGPEVSPENRKKLWKKEQRGRIRKDKSGGFIVVKWEK